MFIYSKRVLLFLDDLKKQIKSILVKELNIKCVGDRFYEKKGIFSYPIKVALFNHRPMLGYFDPDFYELGFHESLMYAKKEQCQSVIRHELAHYFVFITKGYESAPHGVLFKEFCQKAGWGKEVFAASMELDLSPVPQEESGILRKVKKLMALSKSSHQHESEQATIKSQQLLLKHNLELQKLDQEESFICMQRIMKQKTANAKLRAIASILQTFFVSVVFHQGKECVCLEVVGEKENVEIAEYVAGVLAIELDRLWLEVQKTQKLKGLVAKNSFFLGVAKGYCAKIEALQKQSRLDISSGLIMIEKKLAEAQKMVYNRLSSKSSSRICCSHSARLGETMGQKLRINPALKESSTSSIKPNQLNIKKEAFS